ncbi:alpha-galactosidase, partial [bacterium]|nr:alpha-galactosidase [bacterium]
MRRRIGLFLLLVFTLPLVAAASQDWLVEGVNDPVTINVLDSGNTLSISNGLIERTFRLHPNLATISLRHQITEDEFVRGVKPEAQVVINGATYEIGGLKGQPNYAYLEDDWIDELTASPDAFQFKGYSTSDCVPPLEWNQKRYAGETNWPPKGKHLTLNFQAPEIQPALQGVEIAVHYELYQGIPVLSKWVEIQNNADGDVTIDSLTVEILAVVERISEVNLARSTKPRQYQNHIDPNDLALITHSRFHPQSDYMFCGMSYLSADQTNFWEPDPEYLTQVNYDRTWPHLFTSRYPYGPGATIAKGETFTSFRVIELLQDSDDKERRGLAI